MSQTQEWDRDIPFAADGTVYVPSDQDPVPAAPALLESLYDLIAQAKAMPLSATVLINRHEILDLVDQLRDALPEQLTHADEILAGADDALVQAQEEAEAIIATARQRAEELVEHEQVVVQAFARARDIVAQAEETATALRTEADDYCDRRLAEFEIDLGRVLTQVRGGRAKLAERLAADASAED